MQTNRDACSAHLLCDNNLFNLFHDWFNLHQSLVDCVRERLQRRSQSSLVVGRLVFFIDFEILVANIIFAFCVVRISHNSLPCMRLQVPYMKKFVSTSAHIFPQWTVKKTSQKTGEFAREVPEMIHGRAPVSQLCDSVEQNGRMNLGILGSFVNLVFAECTCPCITTGRVGSVWLWARQRGRHAAERKQ